MTFGNRLAFQFESIIKRTEIKRNDLLYKEITALWKVINPFHLSGISKTVYTKFFEFIHFSVLNTNASADEIDSISKVDLALDYVEGEILNLVLFIDSFFECIDAYAKSMLMYCMSHIEPAHCFLQTATEVAYGRSEMKAIAVAAEGTLVHINNEKAYGLVEIPGKGTALMFLSKLDEEDRANPLRGSTVACMVSSSFKDNVAKHFVESVNSIQPRVVLGRIKVFVDQPKKNLCFCKVEVVSETDITEVHLPIQVLADAGVQPIVGTPLFVMLELNSFKGEKSWAAVEVRFDNEVIAAYREVVGQQTTAGVVDLGPDAVGAVTKSYKPGKFGFVTVDGKDCYLPRTVAETSSVAMATLEEAGHAVMVTLRPVPKGHEVTAIALVKNEATAATTEAPTEVAPADTGAAAEGEPAKKRRIKTRRTAVAAPAEASTEVAVPVASADEIPGLVASASPAEAADAGEGTLAAALKAAGVASAAEKAA